MFIIRGTVNWLKGVLRPFTLMKENSISLISFEIIFRILTFLVLFPIMTWTQRLWLISNKTKVIAWYNVGSFVRNPLSWLVLLAMVLMLVAATMFEQFAIYDTLHASRWGKRKTVRQIFSTGFDMCVERLRLENWGLIPYVIFVMRFGSSAIADISSITSVIRIPGFILEDFHKRPWEGNAYRVLVIILTYFFVRWLFAIPIMMEEDSTSFGTACRKSAAMISGKYFFRVLILTACWGVFCYVIFGIGTFLIVTAWYLLSMWVIPGETDPFITFDTMYENGRYVIFAVGSISTEEYGRYYVDFHDLKSTDCEKRQTAIDTLISASVFTCPIDVKVNDQILLLVTCTEKDQDRRVVAARRIRDGEDEPALRKTVDRSRKR